MVSIPSTIDNYIQLCAAIVNSGIKENDQLFLKSEWCKTLISYVVDYNSIHDKDIKIIINRVIGVMDKYNN